MRNLLSRWIDALSWRPANSEASTRKRGDADRSLEVRERSLALGGRLAIARANPAEQVSASNLGPPLVSGDIAVLNE